MCVGGFDGVQRFRLRRKTLACALGIQTVPILHIILIQHDRGGAHVHLITYTHRGEKRKRENKIQMKINKIKTGSDEGQSEKEKREKKRKDVNIRHSFKCIQLSCA